MVAVNRLAHLVAHRHQQAQITSRRRLLAKTMAVVAATTSSLDISRPAAAAYYTYVVRHGSPCRSRPDPNSPWLLTLPCGTYFLGQEVAGVDPGYFNCTERTNIWMRGTFRNYEGVQITCYVPRGNCDPASGGDCYCY